MIHEDNLECPSYHQPGESINAVRKVVTTKNQTNSCA